MPGLGPGKGNAKETLDHGLKDTGVANVSSILRKTSKGTRFYDFVFNDVQLLCSLPPDIEV